MLLEVKPFQSLSVEEKAQFFAHGQSLLIQFHPNSDFIFRQSNVKDRLNEAKSLAHKYQGLCYADDNICVLFNKIVVSDPKDAVATLQANMFRPPHENYNGVSIDFVVFREIKDCMGFCQKQYDPKIQYVVYSKAGKPKIYKTEELMSHVFHMPKATH